MTDIEPLKFKVAPHIVEDLGLNLYTDLPRVLVEFVANAYDADSPGVEIRIDLDAIGQARREMRDKFRFEITQSERTGQDVLPLEEQTLPEDLTIVIEDSGHGMSRSDLDNKFLFAGRRRRLEDSETFTEKGRALMGRKGLGKLAGFGVAKFVEVVSRKKGEASATRIELDFDELIKHRTTHEIEIKDEILSDGGGLGDTGGTRITLSHLLFDPLKSRIDTIKNTISEHFAYVDPDDFEIRINDDIIHPPEIDHPYAWPEPDKDINDLIEHTIENDPDKDITFKYRIRFTPEKKALPAAKRGVRVYSHKRMVCAPSLLEADTNMHGFRMTDYMDGVVCADFIDEEKIDYIATDRQSLRWDSPLLTPLYNFLSKEIKEACKNYQAYRDKKAPDIVREDSYTAGEIKKYEFSKRDEEMAYKFAAILKNSCKKGLDDPVYKNKLPAFIKSIGHGNILAAISALADNPQPGLREVAEQVAKLTADEFDQFISYARARLKGIQAFKKIVASASFEKDENEDIVQEMFENSPWLIDPTYAQLISANKGFKTTFQKLAEIMKIGKFATAESIKTSERPDLVFFLGSSDHTKLVVVELKSSNLPLESKHLDQLQGYMDDVETWCGENLTTAVKIYGQLIGTKAKPSSQERGVKALRRRIKEAGINSPWTVRSFTEVLNDAEAAHSELIEIHSELSKGGSD